jgi:hypothetical protein
MHFLVKDQSSNNALLKNNYLKYDIFFCWSPAFQDSLRKNHEHKYFLLDEAVKIKQFSQSKV